MNGFWKMAVGISAVAALGCLLALGPVVTADEDDDDAGGSKIEKIAKLADELKVPLATAVETAVKKAGGKALQAQLEVEDGTPIFEILVFVPGAEPKLVEVEVDARTGKVVEDDDDEGRDDDGEDDDGGGEDDD